MRRGIPWFFCALHIGLGLVLLLQAPSRGIKTYSQLSSLGGDVTPQWPMLPWALLLIITGCLFFAIDSRQPRRVALVLGAALTLALALATAFSAHSTKTSYDRPVLYILLAGVHVKALFYERTDGSLIWPRRTDT